MTKTFTLRRRALGALLALGLTTPLLAQAAFNPKQLRIGYQKSAAALTLLKSEGTLEKRLAPLGVEVKWVEFPAGPQLLEGLNVGSIDFGFVGEAPPIFAQAAGASFVYVGFEREAPQAESVLVQKESPIRSVSELKGKRVVLNKGSNVHYLLVKLLEKHGLRYSDAQVSFLPPADARAAFERGAVDAWVIWDPFTSAAEHQLDARQIADGSGVVKNYQFFLAEREFASKRGDVLKTVLDEVNRKGQFIAQNTREAARLLAPLQGLEVAVLERALPRYSHGVRAITEEALESQQHIADSFFELKLIPTRLRIKDAAPASLL